MSTFSNPASPNDSPKKLVQSEIAIDVCSVSKHFKLYHQVVSGPIKEILFFWKREHYYKQFLAVDRVSLIVRRGDVVGIVGPNGAGKTTLLKMIAGLLPVDSGTIQVNGKLTALLALGVGVHPEFTGRENIYYGGLLLGMTKDEVLSKTSSIIEFSELGEFIDRPLRTYSSGMRARLLFSISMSIDPDILIIDEALATGDAYFVKKCTARIRSLCDSGATLLLVSHNAAQISQICSRAILMAEGRILEEGEPRCVLNAYNRWVFLREQSIPAVADRGPMPMVGGTGDIRVTSILLKDCNGKESKGFYSGERMEIDIEYASSLPPGSQADLFVGILSAGDQRYVAEFNTLNYVAWPSGAVTSTRLEIALQGTVRLICDPLLLLNNHYSLWVIFYDRESHYHCEYRNVVPFIVARRNLTWMKGDAVFWQPSRIETEGRP